MKRVAGMMLATGIAFAGPAQAEWSEAMATELQALVAAFQTGEDVDTSRIVALSDAAQETGTIPFGIFEGALMPLDGAVPLRGIPASELVCQTTEASSLPRPGVPDVHTDTITIDRAGDGTTQFEFQTVDAVSEMAIRANYDGAAVQLQQMILNDRFGDLRLTPTPDGGFIDDVSGNHFGPNNADARTLNAMIDAIILVNPSWFISEAEVTLGAPWLVAGGEDGMAEALMGLVAGGLAGGGTTQVGFLHSAVSGMTEVRGAPAIVLEVLLDVDIVDSAGFPPANLRIVTSEVYEIERFVRLGYGSNVRVQIGEEVQTISQTQDCFLRNG